MSEPKPALLLDNIGQLSPSTPVGTTARVPAAAPQCASSEWSKTLRFCVSGEAFSVLVRVQQFCKKPPGSMPARSCASTARAGVVVPGFCDSHTHPAFMRPRLIDFEKRIAGASYEEIAAAGGGIRSSTDAVRAASRERT